MTIGSSPPQLKRSKKRKRKFFRSLTQGPVAQSVLSWLAIRYLKLVNRTNTYVVEPEDILETVTPKQPFIVAVWHGQHILLPVIPIGLQASALISRNFDGEVTARVAEYFGNRTIRASGGRKQTDTLKKGGMAGFLEMLRALEDGENIVQTADIPKGIARKAGLGIIMLAQRSGVPIVPLAIASSRRHVFARAWDKAAFNLPFGTTAICVGELVHVPLDATDETLESKRNLLETEMNKITKRAYELTGKPE